MLVEQSVSQAFTLYRATSANTSEVCLNFDLQDSKEIVTGSRPTAAEAISDIPSAAELMALQQKVRSQFGGPQSAFAKREAEQQAARERAITNIAGTPEQRTNNAAAADQAGRANRQPRHRAVQHGRPLSVRDCGLKVGSRAERHRDARGDFCRAGDGA